MLYELKLNNECKSEYINFFNNVNIIKTTKNIINQDFYDKLILFLII